MLEYVKELQMIFPTNFKGLCYCNGRVSTQWAIPTTIPRRSLKLRVVYGDPLAK